MASFSLWPWTILLAVIGLLWLSINGLHGIGRGRGAVFFAVSFLGFWLHGRGGPGLFDYSCDVVALVFLVGAVIGWSMHPRSRRKHMQASDVAPT